MLQYLIPVADIPANPFVELLLQKSDLALFKHVILLKLHQLLVSSHYPIFPSTHRSLDEAPGTVVEEVTDVLVAHGSGETEGKFAVADAGLLVGLVAPRVEAAADQGSNLVPNVFVGFELGHLGVLKKHTEGAGINTRSVLEEPLD